MKKNAIFIIILISASILFGGYVHYIVNDQSQTFDSNSGYRFDALDPEAHNSDSLFICLMFSGGGTRPLPYWPVTCQQGVLVETAGVEPVPKPPLKTAASL